jgi:UDP-N-acetylmuramoyl-tripeptide--D-alanyl-D-alanine ligase
MLELGPSGPELHAEMGRKAAQVADLILTVGALGQHIARGACDAGADRVVHYDQVEQVIDQLNAHLEAGDTLLVKASRGLALWRAVAAIG